jgi:hypothetical protein
VLGLDPALDPDARKIRRAYARQLKRINPELQPDAFQELREAYEFALHWVAEDTEPMHLHDGSAPGSSAPGSAWQALHADPHSGARAVLDEFSQSMISEPPGSHEDARQRLRAALDDPRLEDVDARFTFEGGIANLLAGGWRPGHQHLFAPAILYFEWRTDRPRLQAYGHAGGIVDKAIGELEIHQGQPEAQRQQQREIIRLLRRETPPGRDEPANDAASFEQVVAGYPNWAHVVSRPGNLALWREDRELAAREALSNSARKLGKAARIVAISLVVLAVAGVAGWLLLPDDPMAPGYLDRSTRVVTPDEAAAKASERTVPGAAAAAAAAAAPATAEPAPAASAAATATVAPEAVPEPAPPPAVVVPAPARNKAELAADPHDRKRAQP